MHRLKGVLRTDVYTQSSGTFASVTVNPHSVSVAVEATQQCHLRRYCEQNGTTVQIGRPLRACGGDDMML